MRQRFVTGLAAGLCLLASCTGPNPSYAPDPLSPAECRSGEEGHETLTVFERPNMLDVLVVLDSGGEVLRLHEAFAEAVPAFLESLDEAGISVQVAVTDSETRSSELSPPATDAEGCRDNNTVVASSDDDDWIHSVVCNVLRPAADTGFQQALGVAQDLAIDGRDDIALFRADARSLVIIVTNEDDCTGADNLPSSTAPPRRRCREGANALDDVNALVSEFIAAPATREGLQVAVFAGPPVAAGTTTTRPTCSTSAGSVFPSNRLATFADGLGRAGHFYNICAGDLRPPLLSLAERVTTDSTLSLCPAQTLSQEPLGVDALIDGETVPVLIGEEGYRFHGLTSECGRGEFRIQAEAVYGADEITLRYCTL